MGCFLKKGSTNLALLRMCRTRERTGQFRAGNSARVRKRGRLGTQRARLARKTLSTAERMKERERERRRERMKSRTREREKDEEIKK